MSTNAPASKPKLDRRILRTREQLGDALIELIMQKPFDSITVQDVLGRANIGRSTFYTHFRDKNDLFLSDVDDFMEHMATVLSKRSSESERVAPVQELFAHLAEMRPFYAALVASGRVHDVLEIAQEHFARGIEQRFAEIPRARSIPAEERGPLAHAHAGALLSLMTWWIDRKSPPPPAQMDALFHRTVWGSIASLSEKENA